MIHQESIFTRRRVLKHKIHKGTCQACGAPCVERYRLAIHDVCQGCVDRLFKNKDMENLNK